MVFPCTEPARVRAHGAGSLPAVGSRDRHQAHSSRGTAGGEHLFSHAMTTTHPDFEDTRQLAEWVGLQLVRQHDARNGRFRLLSGPRIVAHSDSLHELQLFALAWRYVR
ncbi:hypothetical protein GCM10007320_61410 [Pseudorhodoferax aquiterrae]|uniref:Uncharacterized protein n=2 Tax=Pseudorhodoferax aquiterrae TaxID=747304 RepID=A0ABQ3GD78_9BURK|nr:hypothetical protein GCM10007320_61410 [Pseudorhodoferax aquiterrae]